MTSIFSSRPPTVKSAHKTTRKVIVQHRSDMLLEEQVRNVKNTQEALEKAFRDVEAARGAEEHQLRQNQVKELKQRLEGMMLVLKIVHKVNTELVYARLDLQKALKEGKNSNISLARKRISWLEDRVVNLLGKCRQRSFNIDAKRLRGEAGEMPSECGGFDDNFSEICSMESPKQSSETSALTGRTKDASDSESDADSSVRHSMIGANVLESLDRAQSTATRDDDDMRELIESSMASEFSRKKKKKKRKRHSTDTSFNVDSEDQHGVVKSSQAPGESNMGSSHADSPPPVAVGIKVKPSTSTLKSDQDLTTASETSSSCLSDSESDTESGVLTQKSGMLPPGSKGTRSHISRGSRVTIKTPTELEFLEERESENEPFEEENLVTAEEHFMDKEQDQESCSYWDSEHHRFDYNEYVKVLLQLDPLSYHQMGLAIPGTFVDEVHRPVELPWKPKRTGSDSTDIHRIALDNLSANVNKMYSTIREASLLSVKPSDSEEFKGPSMWMDYALVAGQSPAPVVDEPSLTKHGLTRPDSKATIVFPPLNKERLGSSLSNRLVYYPKPLPYPDKLPITRTDRSMEFPRNSKNFSQSEPGVVEAAERVADQRNLYNETKFTSSLFRPRISSKAALTSSEKRFHDMLKAEEETKKLEPPKEEAPADPEQGQKKSLKAALLMAKSMIKFQGALKWKELKPKSGPLAHSGLKWERVKSMVHTNLVSVNVEERVDAARHLGILACGDSMVLYALRERLRHDDDERVIYEATKSLITLGCWDEEVLVQIVHYLLEGNRDMKQDILKAMIIGKNIQFIDKRMKTFKDVVRVLSLLCKCSDPEDKISFHAAVALGKMCVMDDNATRKLRGMFDKSQNAHRKAEALDILVRQMHQKDRVVVEAVLNQLQKCPMWKQRKAAARQLIHLGSKHVLIDGQEEKVFEILERRLWDDPNKNVRQEVAKVLAALGLFAKACEKVEKKLEDSLEEVRVEAVISVGTLGMKNERTLKALLEMIDLDPSPQVRLMIMRTFGILNAQDKRVFRALRIRASGDGPIATEAKRVLDQLSKQPVPCSRGSQNGRQQTGGSKPSSKGQLSKNNTALSLTL